jgi:hypothetical protein
LPVFYLLQAQVFSFFAMARQLDASKRNFLLILRGASEIPGRGEIQLRQIRSMYDKAHKKDGIVSGLEIVEIDGVPVKQYAKQRGMPFQGASTPQDLAVFADERALLVSSVREPAERFCLFISSAVHQGFPSSPRL